MVEIGHNAVSVPRTSSRSSHIANNFAICIRFCCFSCDKTVVKTNKEVERDLWHDDENEINSVGFAYRYSQFTYCIRANTFQLQRRMAMLESFVGPNRANGKRKKVLPREIELKKKITGQID